MNIGKAIETARKAKGLRQNQLAELSGISQTYLSQIENNRSDANMKTMRNLSDALGVPLPFLLLTALDDEDIEEDKKVLFKSLYPILKSTIEQFVANNDSL